VYKSEKRDKKRFKKKFGPKGSITASIAYMQTNKGQARKSKQFLDKVTNKPSVHFLLSN